MITKTDLIEWSKLQKQLKQIKALEMKLRKEIAAVVMGEVQSGTEHKIFDNAEATAAIKLNYSVDKGVLLAIQDDLSDEERNCIEWSPKLSLTKYKKLKETKGETLFPLVQAITIKPSTPTLTVDILEELP